MYFRGVVGVGQMEDRSGTTTTTTAENNNRASPTGDSTQHEEARLHADSDDGSQSQDPGFVLC